MKGFAREKSAKPGHLHNFRPIKLEMAHFTKGLSLAQYLPLKLALSCQNIFRLVSSCNIIKYGLIGAIYVPRRRIVFPSFIIYVYSTSREDKLIGST